MQDRYWITSYQIYDYNTNKLLAKYDSTQTELRLFDRQSPGTNFKVTFTVNVFTGGSGDLSLIN